MSEQRIIDFLKNRPKQKFSADDLSKELSLKKRAIYLIMRKLEPNKCILSTQSSSSKGGYKVTMYEYMERTEMDQIYDMLVNLRHSKYPMVNMDVLSNIAIIAELKDMKKLLEKNSKGN